MVPVLSAHEHPLKSTEILIVFGTINYPVERFCRAILFEVSSFRSLSVTVGGQQHDEMTSRLHYLVQGLLLRHAEKYTDAALLGPFANLAKRAFRAVCKIHFQVAELVDKAPLNDIAKYSCVLSDPFRCFENCLHRDLLQCLDNSAKQACRRGVERVATGSRNKSVTIEAP
jgi:hypothetical protein